MVNLTFGEQVKIILSRKGMTIKQLAELVEQHTGKPMSRQNMTQRLGRDNFQEQDMRLIAEILGCKFTLSIMESEEEVELHPLEREVTIGELAIVNETEDRDLSGEEATLTGEEKVATQQAADEKALLRKGIGGYFRKITPNKSEEAKAQLPQSEQSATAEQPSVVGDINPYTGKEYKTNSVRMHPKRIGYVQVYDQEQHKWTDMTEWAFLGYQERKKALLGKDYEPPIYLD